MNEKITKLFMPKKVIKYENMSASELKMIRRWEYFKSSIQISVAFLVGFMLCQTAVIGAYQDEGIETLIEMVTAEPDYIVSSLLSIAILLLIGIVLDFLPVQAEKIKKRYTRVINYDS